MVLPPVPVVAVPGPFATTTGADVLGPGVVDAGRAPPSDLKPETEQRHVSTLTGCRLGGGSHLSPTQPAQVASLSVVSAASLVNQLGSNYCKLLSFDYNPLTSVLGRLSIVDGLQVVKLLNFIETLFRAKDFPGTSDTLFLQLIFPHC